MEEIQARHRKELKSLEGEKRAALKKAKGTKGKKAKDALAAWVLCHLIMMMITASLHPLRSHIFHWCFFKLEYLSLEEEYVTKLTELQERHKQELAALQGDDAPPEESTTTADAKDSTITPPQQQEEEVEDAEKAARERKQAKARRKRQVQREKEKQLDAERERDLAGPSARTDELAVLKIKLDPLSLKVKPVASDGHCLYRAVAAQCGDDIDYSQVRE